MNLKENYKNLIEARNKIEKIINESYFDQLTKMDLDIIRNRIERTIIDFEIEMEENKWKEN